MPGLVSRLAQLRSQLELPLVRRAVGLFDGMHASTLKGQGMDFEDLHLYSPGDDVTDIDWKSTARSAIPIIKRFKKLSNASVILLVDTGRSMAALTPSGEVKFAVAQHAAAVVAYLARERGDQLALLASDAQRVIQLPGRAGTFHAELLLRSLNTPVDPEGPRSDISTMLHRAATSFVRSGLAVLITDEAHPDDNDEGSLRRLREKHQLLVIAVADASASDSQFVGAEPLDVDTQVELPEFVRTRKRVNARERQIRLQRSALIGARMQRYGAIQARVTSTADVLPNLVRALARGKRGRL